MAEERILVLQANTTDFIYKHFNGNFFIPRQDAIERMAKGMARRFDPDRPNEKEYEIIWETQLIIQVKQYYRKKAEAALNALLEG